MQSYTSKTQDNESKSIVNNTLKIQSSEESALKFADNRPETIAQRKLQDKTDNSPQAKRVAQFQTMANSYSDRQQQPINNTGLPDNLKSGIESLSGIDMSDTRVHYNSPKPAQLQAHAYAQGTDIHIASGQEKHLPHEAWHVVQQKQGRVKPTMQMKGEININDDTGLEKEADVTGAKALSVTSEQVSTIKSLTPTHAPMQLKMGFEFESAKNKVLGADRKFIVYENDQFSLEADTKEDVEFVTKPFSKKSDVLGAVGAAAEMAADIVAGKNGDKKYEFVKGGNVKNDATIEVNDDLFRASAQSTEGVRLENLGELIDEHIGRRKAITRTSRNTADEVLEENNLTLTDHLQRKIHGLIQYMALYVLQVKNRTDENLKNDDGPKAYFRLMARSDFNTMFRSIANDNDFGRYPRQKEVKVTLVRDLVKEKLPGELDLGLDDYIFYSGSYKEARDDPMRDRNKGPKLGDWINSIFTTEIAKDMMSPPPGYTAHADLPPEYRYGMGAYGMDEDKALVEMRGHRNKLRNTGRFEENSGKIPKTQWVPFANHFFTTAVARNDSLENDM
ncbi:DUF4157 domain-containing protein [Flavivirga aquimarina]|uniref:DUF4157 domain-containing protein n=1 Tax=Flavivirga aquimarina TaxID=2027862 RepID=A0ABT8W794_9FLAO|nr:DUF4157 domain-containing protein [Flavivirga aquimarina]MDO5968971.1 DUF4157 domain-containing protein [Flavivirga aquimarina]